MRAEGEGLARGAVENEGEPLESVRRRLGELRLEVLRLRASRRTLMAVLEIERRERAVLEHRLEALRARVRGERARARARGAVLDGR
jgi:predicted RNase H-like nuclease (RuvC/YqgF family)